MSDGANETDPCRTLITSKLQRAGGDLHQLARRGIDFPQVAAQAGKPDTDPFDLLCHLAFNAPVLTRRQRADRVAQASPPASFCTVPVPESGAQDTLAAGSGGTPAELAAATAALHACFSPEAHEILNDLLEKYATDDELQLTLPDVLKVPPISHHGNVAEIIANSAAQTNSATP